MAMLCGEIIFPPVVLAAAGLFLRVSNIHAQVPEQSVGGHADFRIDGIDVAWNEKSDFNGKKNKCWVSI